MLKLVLIFQYWLFMMADVDRFKAINDKKLANSESCNMASEIAIIKVPVRIVYLQAFAMPETGFGRIAGCLAVSDNSYLPVKSQVSNNGDKRAGIAFCVCCVRCNEEPQRKVQDYTRSKPVMGTKFTLCEF